jgi:hypothetical protein
MLRNSLLGAAALAVLAGSQAGAAVTISGKPTINFTCTSGVCTATARQANLNAGDLVSMLGSSDVTVANGALTKDIDVQVALSWASTHGLTLDSRRAIDISRPISVTGGGSLSLKLNDGGSDGNLNFLPRGAITFMDTSSHFSIGGTTFTLVSDLETLASDIAAQPSGSYALANSYNAAPDGVYADDPVTTVFHGYFEGLGNTISGLKIKSLTSGNSVGLFHGIEDGIVADLHIKGARVQGGKHVTTGALAGQCSGEFSNITVASDVSAGFESYVGGICGVVQGNVTGLHSSGTVTGNGDNGTIQSAAGGVAGLMQGGNIMGNSSSTSAVTGAKGWTVGGLLGETTGDNSLLDLYATGTVSVGDNGTAGGLIGNNSNTSVLNDSYATGFVIGGVSSTVGGFIGLNDGAVKTSYSSGPVASGSGNAVGGFIGNDLGASDLTDTYWDIDTSGQSHGVGSNTGYPGITALTTAQFQAGLPGGFNSLFWAEDPAINNGLPYLLSNPQ